MPGDEQNKPEIDVWLGRVPAVVAVLSLGALLMSVVFEWGYFSIVGEPYQTLFTPADYLTNALLWFPATVFWVAATTIGLPVGSVMRRYHPLVPLEWGQHGDARRVPPRVLGVMTLLGVSGLGLSIALGSLSFLMVATITALGIALSYIWTNSGFEIACATVMALLLVCIFIMGQAHARTDLSAFGPVSVITLKDQSERRLILLRTIEKGIVFSDRATDGVGFLRWDEIRGLRARPDTTSSLHRWMCLNVGFQCPAPSRVP